MNISQMSDGTLHSHTLKILNRIEDILSRPCTQSDSHICRTIADELGYSLSYVRDIFKISTGISIRKYITRRRYTIIVSSYSADEFCQLKMHETIQGVKNFKLKVFREFPMLKSTYTQDVLQPPIEEDALSTSIDRAYETQMLSEVFDDITENRNLFEILDGEETILLQDLRDVFVDLDNIYFKYRDIVFKIIASVYVKEAVYRDYHASALFGLPLYSYSP
ncbi:MAG: helix-turn-helix transcriptional regulator [Lachnospiraceae bacterium]|nr:helix-turn-helix transcriptional regulator [Lachnospiraceae bacterium]